MIEHKHLDEVFDKSLFQDIFDTFEMRYVVLYAYQLHNMFKENDNDDISAMSQPDAESDSVLDENKGLDKSDMDLDQLIAQGNDNSIDQKGGKITPYEETTESTYSLNALVEMGEPTIANMIRSCSTGLIQNMLQFHLIMNIKDYKSFEAKSLDFKVKIAKGWTFKGEFDAEPSEFQFKEDFLQRVICQDIPEFTISQIRNALKRLRAMPCPRTNIIHKLVNCYGDFYSLDKEFHVLIDSMGNPFQALRLELMMRKMAMKYDEIEKNIHELLNIFSDDLKSAAIIDKIREGLKKHPNNTDYIQLWCDKTRKNNIDVKFRIKFPDEIPQEYKEWRKIVNEIIGYKLKFQDIEIKIDNIKSYYSGKHQIMSYVEFIKKCTFEDTFHEKISDLINEARNSLKNVSIGLENFNKREIQKIDLNIRKLILDQGLDEDDEG